MEDSTTPQPEINLRKVKLERLGLFVEYETGEAEGYAEMTAKHLRPAHADLIAAFAALVPHLCFMADLVPGVLVAGALVRGSLVFAPNFIGENQPLHEAPEFESYKVTGISFSTTGVVLVGQKKLRGGKVLNLVTPHEVLEPEQETGGEYSYLLELKQALDEVEVEVLAYMGGKMAPVGQTELDFTPPA